MERSPTRCEASFFSGFRNAKKTPCPKVSLHRTPRFTTRYELDQYLGLGRLHDPRRYRHGWQRLHRDHLTVSLAAGAVSATATIPVLNDVVIDSDETVNMTLESAVNSTLGTPAATVLTIRNTDSKFAFAADKLFPENSNSAGL